MISGLRMHGRKADITCGGGSKGNSSSYLALPFGKADDVLVSNSWNNIHPSKYGQQDRRDQE